MEDILKTFSIQNALYHKYNWEIIRCAVLIKLINRRSGLRTSELATIWCMMLVTIGIPTVGLARWLSQNRQSRSTFVGSSIRSPRRQFAEIEGPFSGRIGWWR